MLLVTSNKSRQLLHISYIGQVLPEELARGEKDIKELLAGLSSNFRLLANFSQLKSMRLDCQMGIGRIMELIDRSGVGLVVRVIPEPSKDIGLNILTIFHYPHHPDMMTCASMAEAGKHLAL